MPKLKALLLAILFAGIILELFFLLSPKFQSQKNIKTFVADSFSECADKDNWRNCYGKKIATLTKTYDFALALNAISELQARDEKVNDCHILAHYAAISAVEKDPGQWQDILKLVDLSDCNYGYIHGALEGLSRVDPNFLINERTIPKICAQVTAIKRSPGSDQGCAHIMGHLTLAGFCNKDITKAVDSAVNVCSLVNDTLQHECFAGIFMESFTRDNLVAHCESSKVAWDEELIIKQEELCKAYEGEASISCWQEISHLYNAYYPNDPEMVYKKCLGANDPKKISSCYFHAVATLIQGPTDTSYLRAICQPLIENYSNYTSCTTQATGAIMTASINSVEKAVAFCRAYSENVQTNCVENIIRKIKNKTRGTERINACNKLPPEYASDCTNNQ